MSETTITIPIDPDTATRYYAASDEERRKVQLLLRMLLQTNPTTATTTLQQIMDDLSYEAQAKGLTPEILDELLHDET